MSTHPNSRSVSSNGGGGELVGHATAAVASASAIHWDIEEDHLLSYFLGGNDAGGNDGANDVAAEHRTNDENIDIAEPNIFRPSSEPINGNSVVHWTNGNDIAAEGANSRAENGGSSLLGNSARRRSSAEPPSTPAVHFCEVPTAAAPQPNQKVSSVDALPSSSEYSSFVHASQQQRQSSSSLQNRSGSTGSIHKVPSRTDTTSSSSSSLSSMAAALALGGPNQVLYMQQKLQAREFPASHTHPNNSSPLTPVNMLGSPSGQEMMMLPPPPRFPTNGIHPFLQLHDMQQKQIQPDEMQQQRTHQQNKHQIQQTHQNFQQTHQNFQQTHQNFQQTHQNLQQTQIDNKNIQQIQMQPHIGQSQQPTSGHPPWNQPLNPDPQYSQQHVEWIRQMNAAALMASQQYQSQQQQNSHQLQHPSFPNASSATGVTPHHYHQQQIQVGFDGTTIPVTSFPGVNGSMLYQIHPNMMPSASLRLFTNAFNEVNKGEEAEQLDPAVLAEKRQRRLARNRESARQSRRRKKEHLANLGSKVNRLQNQLDKELRTKLCSMEKGLARQRCSMIDDLVCLNGSGKAIDGSLALFFQNNSANSPVRRSVIVHQFNVLRQCLLSTHNQFALWMMMQPEQFFTTAKNMRLKEQPSKATKGAAGRANSKQRGEEIFNDEKKSGKDITSRAHDLPRMWPLFCHELQITMDQEDRVYQAHEQAKRTHNLHKKLQQIKMTTKATSHLRNASLCLSHCCSHHNESLLLDVLTPSQTILFLDWFGKNKDRCKAAMKRQMKEAVKPKNVDTLEDACKQLDEIMSINRKENTSSSVESGNSMRKDGNRKQGDTDTLNIQTR